MQCTGKQQVIKIVSGAWVKLKFRAFSACLASLLTEYDHSVVCRLTFLSLQLLFVVFLTHSDNAFGGQLLMNVYTQFGLKLAMACSSRCELEVTEEEEKEGSNSRE